MRRHILAALSIAFCAIFALHAEPSSANGHGKHLVRIYKATLLLNPDTQTQFFARDLSNRGEVSGEINGPDGRLHAAIWRHGRVVPLEEFDLSIESSAVTLNDHGDVAGLDGTHTQFFGVFWHDGAVTMLGSSEGDLTLVPKRMNNRGQVVASSGLGIPYVWTGGSFEQLEQAPDGQNAFGEDINNAGSVTGWDVGPTGTRALLWRNGTVEVLGSLPGMTDTRALGLNDFDHVVGVSQNLSTSIERAFFWRHGQMKQLPLVHRADDESSTALAINTWGQVVGNEKTGGSGLTFAVLWERGRAFDLNALIRSALKPHITLRSAFRINEWGQILVSAEDDRVVNADFTYLLTPVYEWH
jgi:uncharacterized membrane protein